MHRKMELKRFVVPPTPEHELTRIRIRIQMHKGINTLGLRNKRKSANKLNSTNMFICSWPLQLKPDLNTLLIIFGANILSLANQKF